MKNNYLLVFLIYIFVYLPAIFINAEDCEPEYGVQIVCPTQDVPTHFSSCCWKNNTMSCCPSSSYMDDSLVMMISIFVILMCLLLSVLFVVCCFWSPCPLYSVCRMNYTYGDIVAYSKAEEALNLPPENIHKNNYTPLHINVKAVSED
ncbi:uncharacterized protein [Halyomorpha halys]|uniref:uncharacterized protein n=1 Tax=Halyomorpha halys TaxID=286706 RepID=UPI0006D4CE42|nr:uncharacterized protein LOC106688293 [Halyomorpha halys]